MLGLVNEGISHENMVGSTAAFGEGVGDIGLCHKVHEAGIEDTSEELAKAAGDGYGVVICGVLFGAFFMKDCDVGFLPWGGELGCLV